VALPKDVAKARGKQAPRDGGGLKGLVDDRVAHPWLLLSLAGVGVVAVGGTLVTLFSALGDRPAETWATDAPEVGSRDFLLGISGSVNAPLSKGGSVRLLNNGGEIFPAILREIRAARQTINFLAYIWEPGRASDQLFDALVERAGAGVQVRLLLDGLGARRAPEDRIGELRRAGGKVARFRTLAPGKITRFHRRNHRRAIVIDGNVGFTGGAAVADYWLDAPGEGGWRDIMVEVRGCIAGNLQSAFAQVWSGACGEILLGPSFYPPDDDDEEQGEHVTWHVNVISSPSSDAEPVRLFFWSTFRCARRRLYVTSPYFLPDDDTVKVLASRAREGVDVRILVPDEHNDMRPVRMASHGAYRLLLEAGVRIYEYQPAMIHAKTVVVDGKWSVVGSANMDIRSRELNLENVLGILDEGFARDLERTFLKDLEHAEEITLDEWNSRTNWGRAGEWFWRLFSEQL
jgi:cardiolipin synthase